MKRDFSGKNKYRDYRKGKRQIEATVNKLKDEPIDVVYSSPLKRAFVTAKSIAESHNIPEDKNILDDDLMEINAGIWDGMYIKDIVRLFPEQSDNWDNHPERFNPEKAREWKAFISVLAEC